MARLGWQGLSVGVLALASATGAARADVTISAKPTSNVICAAGVCTPTAAKAVLNVGELAGLLASGDVSVNTAGALAANIQISAALSWTSTSRLTLDAYQSVTVSKPVSVTGTGALTVTTDDGGSGGDLTFEGKGRAVFWDMTSSLVINGQSFVLVKTLNALKAAISADWHGAYALADSDNVKRKVFNKAPIKRFFGTLEGLGNVVAHFTMSNIRHNPPPLALIDDNDGTIRDLGLTNINLQGTPSEGLLAGLVATNGGTVQNCHVTGVIQDGADSGGLVGFNLGTIRHSHASVDVTGGESEAGGLVAANGTQATIETSYATGAVGGFYAGGLVGVNDGMIDQSFAAGNVSNVNGAAGGLVGLNESAISNSYATGAISGGDAGGLVGVHQGNAVTSIYSIGIVSGGTRGGLVGVDESQNFSSAYWDLDASGINDPNQGAGNPASDPGITGLTTAQFQSGSPIGFDPAIWAEKPGVNGGYPYLKATSPH